VTKVGIIGCGGISQVHAWALSQMDDVLMTVFCDTVPAKAEALAEK
jgi:predicted dehydrogenase